MSEKILLASCHIKTKNVYRCVYKDNDLLSTVMIITCFDLSGKQKY